MEAAVGLAPPPRMRRGQTALGLSCPACGTDGRIDMVDTPAQKAHLTCPSCACTWETSRSAVRA